jgi:hypothetical protein
VTDGGPSLACPECGNRQLEGRERCTSCGYTDGLLSLDNDEHVDLLRDIDDRRMDKHEKRSRLIAVVIGVGVVFALWFVPGYWTYERRVAMPFLFDQWALMIAIGFGLTLVFKQFRPKKLFPYIN